MNCSKLDDGMRLQRQQAMSLKQLQAKPKEITPSAVAGNPISVIPATGVRFAGSPAPAGSKLKDLYA